MKKIFLALLICVMALTITAGFKAKAADDGYTWIDDYETAGKKVMYPRGARSSFTDTTWLGVSYSGVDVILGDWVYTVSKANVFLPESSLAPGYDSLGQLYVNTSNEDWYIQRAIEASFVEAFIDENGQVYQIDNSYLSFDFGQCEALDGSVIIPTDPANECAQGTGIVQLRYLDSDLEGTLDKADIDANKVETITFVEEDLVYEDADGKYTNVATDNTPVMKQQQSVFDAEDPLVVDGTVIEGALKYSYVDSSGESDVTVYTDQATVTGFDVTPVMENVIGNLWTDGTDEIALDSDYDAEADGYALYTTIGAKSAAGQFDVWWDDVAGEMDFAATGWLSHKPHESHQLTYAELNGGTASTYQWLTKDLVDSKTAEGITWADTDEIYKDDAGDYTNVVTEDLVMNEDLGFVIPAGHSVLAFEYLDRSNYNNDDYLKSLYTVVNGIDGTAEIIEHDVTAPTISGVLAEDNVLVGQEYNPEGILASDFALYLDDTDDETPAVTNTIYSYNSETEEFDIVVEEIDTTLAGPQYNVVYTSTDTTGNTATKSTLVTVVAGFSPIFTGIANQSINEGDTVDLFDGITATDGYGNDITNKIMVLQSSFNPDTPGTYEIYYYVENANKIVTIEPAVITVLDTTGPVVEDIDTIQINQGTNFDLKSPIEAIDNVDKTLDLIVSDDGDFDYNTPATYTVVVDVYDLAGNMTTETYDIEVIATSDTTSGQIDQLESDLSDLQTQLDELEDESASKDQNSVIYTAVIALLAVGGLSVGLTSLFKRQ